MEDYKTPSLETLDGRIALVTGASHGIGEAFARGFAAAGARVALAARTVKDLERVAADIESGKRRALVLPTDVCDLDAVSAMVRRTVDHFGRLDILANVAGVNRRKPIFDVTPEDWDYVVGINLRGLYFASQAAARVMAQQGYGKIIHIASMTSYRGFQNLSIYGITKMAVVSLTRTQAVEWAQHGIRVNAIAPGWIDTPLTATMPPDWRRWVEAHVPQGHFGTPDDLVPLAVYLASPASNYVTGQTFAVDGGFLAGNPWSAMPSGS